MVQHHHELPVFEIGLTFAGAISAGAYSAGVADCLIRAIEAHNQRALSGAAGAPRHLVTIKAMSGASAGSVTLAAATADLVGPSDPQGEGVFDLEPRDYAKQGGGTARYPVGLKALHKIWVRRLGLWQENTAGEMDGLLATDDLAADAPLTSLLNGTYVDRVADDVLADVVWTRPNAGLTCVAADLDLFLMTTSLTSVPYSVQFVTDGDLPGKADEFRMANHSAVRHFRLHGLGQIALPSPWLDAWSDEGIALCPPAEPDTRLFGGRLREWSALKQAALASAAFPIGLSTRMIAAEAEEFGQIDKDCRADGGARTLNVDPRHVQIALPDFGIDAETKTEVFYHAVDGGILNNEPFEYARYAIRDPANGGRGFLAPNKRDPKEADRAVILVDPFPEGPDYTPVPKAEHGTRLGLLAMLQNLFPTLINQARFKPSEIVGAADPTVASRFIIRPARTDADGTERVGKTAIACGTLQGFGGFVDFSFREHDFVLGQINCAAFLRDVFTVDADNTAIGTPGETGTLRIINPGPAFPVPDALPAWPALKYSAIVTLVDQIRVRLRAIGRPLLNELKITGLFRPIFHAAWCIRWPLRGFAKRFEAWIVAAILSDLLSSGVLSDVTTLPAREQAILQALIGARRRRLALDEISATVTQATDLTAREVREAVGALVARGYLWQIDRPLQPAVVGFAVEPPSWVRKVLIKMNFLG